MDHRLPRRRQRDASKRRTEPTAGSSHVSNVYNNTTTVSADAVTKTEASLNADRGDAFVDESAFPIPPCRYVTIRQGDLPLVLSAPHGGKEKPGWVPNLTCHSHVRDAHTFELTEKLIQHIAEKYGKIPFAVLNRLHRQKMDANRDINTATEGTDFATRVYNIYHDALSKCCVKAREYSPTSREALLLDIHGYASLPNANTLDTCWIMVGHLVPAKILKNHGSLLANDEWIRGPASLGSLLEKHGLAAEPSSRKRVPSRQKYLHGGYITKVHRHAGSIRTIQLEFPRPMRDDLDCVVPKVAEAIMELLREWEFVDQSHL